MTDNVRKIFDMLGVEPNEEFKIRGIDEITYYIDDELYIYRDNELCNDKGLSNLINGYFKIIKLSKESKTKKLRELTPEDFDKWKKKNCVFDTCEKCIFNKVSCSSYSNLSWIYNKDLYSDKFLDQEIEVEEE